LKTEAAQEKLKHDEDDTLSAVISIKQKVISSQMFHRKSFFVIVGNDIKQFKTTPNINKTVKINLETGSKLYSTKLF